MKKCVNVLILMICLLMSIQSIAFADNDKIGKGYTIDGECTFTIKNAKSYDIFFNQDSGSSKEWIIISFQLLNWRNEPFYIKTETEAKVIYDGDFEYEADYLWVNPEGSYYRARDKDWIWIYAMDDDGIVYSNYKDNGGGYVSPAVGDACLYDPNKCLFYFTNRGIDSDRSYVSKDSSKTVLDPLVERTYHYAFLVPDLVAEEEGAREVIFTVAGEEYSFRF